MQLQLNNFHIKLLAAIFMVIDHVGVVFFPNVLAFRMVGRLSFPLFAWLLTQGEQHTRNIERYLLRLVVLGIVSQPLNMGLTGLQSLDCYPSFALAIAGGEFGWDYISFWRSPLAVSAYFNCPLPSHRCFC
jgi:hypothetical protein